MDHRTRALCLSGAVAALYVVLTVVFSAISFGPVQFRVAEALTLLPAVWPETVWGLAVGCLIANLLGGAPLWDVLFGTLATLIAAALVRFSKGSLWLRALAPVAVNGLIIGLVLTWAYGIPTLFLNILTVALGEAGVCYALGVPLALYLERIRSPLE